MPSFPVGLAAPDLSPWREGNTGVPGFLSWTGPAPGPHTVAVSLVHGNEIAGAIALDRLLRERLRPARGRLTLGFANLDAFDRFDPEHPTASRFVDEDMNRLWDEAVLDGPRHSSELARARAMRPIIDTADVLIDLHSMLWPSDPLILCGPAAKGRALAMRVGTPAMVVGDSGHRSGLRLIDYAPFVDPAREETAILVEAGQHWEPATVAASLASLRALLRVTGQWPGADATDGAGAEGPCRSVEVTAAITATTGAFAFVQPFRGGDVVRRRDTLIAMDGPHEIRTPYDDCVLIMPSLRPSRGHTAVRLARMI
jgi:predicted deacylase